MRPDKDPKRQKGRDAKMLRTTICLAGAMAVALAMSSEASASDFRLFVGRSPYYHSRHHQVHADLDHHAVHRGLEHREAHRYPMTWRQHGRLHDVVDHEAYHDARDHRRLHRSNAYRYSGGGLYFGGRRGGFYFAW